MKILSFGTYPIRRPIHGGQRRISSIGAYYEAAGHKFRYASVYMPNAYKADAVTVDDVPYGSPGGMFSEIPFIDDLGSGFFASENAEPLNHFRAIVDEFKPDVVQLEQPFMWPLVKKMQALGDLDGVVIVYSSQNHESPLKRAILEGAGVSRENINRAVSSIEDMECELTEAADVVVAVSHSEASYYKSQNPLIPVLTIRNGTDRPGRLKRPAGGGELSRGEYLVFVGSAYPPNISGFCKFVLGNSLYGLPPRKLISICGGASNGIFSSGDYLPHATSYGDRVHFFPHPSDEELHWIQNGAKGSLLPIASGGGSNLKTAEALCSGKWLIATPVALRSFEDFEGEKGVLVAHTPKQFRDAMLDVIYSPPLQLSNAEISKRHGLYWDNLLKKSGLIAEVEAVVKCVQARRSS